MYDVIIVGGGPAGLSAALLLGRCRRRTLLIDAGRPRNAASHAMHGYLGRDGSDPREFLREAQAQLVPYHTVETMRAEVQSARTHERGFEVTLADGPSIQARKLVLATGVQDVLPPHEGFDACYGRSAHHCPYCDGWEWREAPIAALGPGGAAVGLALELTLWSRDLVLFTDGPAPEIEDHVRERLRGQHIELVETPIARLEHEGGRLRALVLEDGRRIERSALFFNYGQKPNILLAEMLGCQVSEKGTIQTGPFETTHVPGLYVVGDASRSVQMVVVAAAEGAEAAVAVNTALLKDETA